MRTKELRAQRAQLVADARKLVEGDQPSAEQHAQFDALMVKADEMKAQIDRLERSDAVTAELSNMRDTTSQQRGVSPDQVAEEQATELRIFSNWARGGFEALAPEDRILARTRMGPVGGQFQNAQGTGTGGAGGYTVPAAFMAQLLVTLKAFGGMRQIARTVDTPQGQDVPWPTLDDTANMGEIIPENTQISQQDVAFGTVTLKGYTYSSKLVLVSWQLLQDSAFDIEALLRDVFTNRLGRVTNLHFTTGTGTGQPQGAVTAAPVGKVGGAGQVTSITYDDLIDLEHSVDPAYRGAARFMFHDNTLRVLRKMKDADGRPLWQDGVQVGAPDTINGRSYVINQDMPVMGASAKSVLFGDFQNYLIRNIKDMQVVRLNERYADYLQTGFFAYGRFDGRLISAGQPIKAYQNAAA